MKKFACFFVFFFCVYFSGGIAQAAYRSFDGAAGIAPSKTVDKTQLEGWIIEVNYQQNNFRLMDPRGFDRKVTPKAGTIAGYRLGDHVKVVIDQNYPRATLVEKL